MRLELFELGFLEIELNSVVASCHSVDISVNVAILLNFCEVLVEDHEEKIDKNATKTSNDKT